MDVFNRLYDEISQEMEKFGIEPGSQWLFNVINNLVNDATHNDDDFWSLLRFIYSPSEIIAMNFDIMEPVVHSLFTELSEA